MPKISVIIPVHNSDQTLEKCLDSIINQTYRDLEILLVENGSSDNSVNICKRYEKEDERIKTLILNESGISKARNAGLNSLTGEYFCFVDSDDYVDLNLCEVLLHKAIEKKADMTLCRINNVFSDGTIDKSMEMNLEDLIDGRIEHLFLDGERYVRNVVWRILYKTSSFSDIRFNEEMNVNEDKKYLYDCFLRDPQIAVANEYLYFYRYFYDKPQIIYKKYYQDYKTTYRTRRLLLTGADKFLAHYGLDELAAANRFKAFVDVIILSLRYYEHPFYKIKLLLQDEYWKSINTRKNYKEYRKFYHGKKDRIKSCLVRRKCYHLLKLLLKNK